MSNKFRLTLAQVNPTVGDLAGNAELARRAWAVGRDAGADMVAMSENAHHWLSDAGLNPPPSVHFRGRGHDACFGQGLR